MKPTRIVHLSLSADGSLLREETLNGVKYIVCPVISKLGDNVEWPINAPTPEFIPASVLSLATENRNNRPVVMGHPQDENGEYISANSPDILEEYAYGFTFAAKFEDNKVSSEMWLDPIRAEKVNGASRVIERLQASEMVEVSEGDYVLSEIEEGEWNGKAYGARWVACWSDHLATLPEGHIGACSIDDGCGALRASSGYKSNSKITVIRSSDRILNLWQALADKFDDFEAILKHTDDHVVYMGESSISSTGEFENNFYTVGFKEEKNGSISISDLVTKVSRKSSEYGVLCAEATAAKGKKVSSVLSQTTKPTYLANLPDKKVEVAMANPLKRILDSMANTLRVAMSNNDLRWKLYKAIEKIDPGISFVHDEDLATGEVLYCTVVRLGGDYFEDSEREYHNWKRTFTIDDKENVTVNDDAVEIEWYQGWKPLGEATPKIVTETTTISAASTCGCQKGDKAMAFDRKSVINRLSGLTNGPFIGNTKALEAMDDKGLEGLDKAFPDKVEEEKKEATVEPITTITPPVVTTTSLTETPTVSLSREDYANMKASADAFMTQQAAHKSGLVTSLKSAQTEFTEVDLTSMEIPQLERMSRLLKINQPTNSSYVGLPIPRDASNEDKAPPVLSVTEKIRAMRKSA